MMIAIIWWDRYWLQGSTRTRVRGYCTNKSMTNLLDYFKYDFSAWKDYCITTKFVSIYTIFTLSSHVTLFDGKGSNSAHLFDFTKVCRV